MPEEGFLRRWSRVKASGGEAAVEPKPAPVAAPLLPPAPPVQSEPAPVAPAQPAPTLLDAQQLTSSSDFSAFVSPLVDQDVRRLALKKLFADPHFNVLDRLDMYMDDYNKPDPVSAAMLAALDHARGSVRRPEEVEAGFARMRAEDARAAEEALAAAEAQDEAPVVADASAAPDAPGDEAQQEAPAVIADDPLHIDEQDRLHEPERIALPPADAHNAQAGA